MSTKKSEWHKLGEITSGRMKAVWTVARMNDFRNLKAFWKWAQNQGWDFYDVLQVGSPFA